MRSTRWHKIKTVATFEFLTTVKRTGYLVTTFGMPLFMAAYGAIVALPSYYAERSAEREPSIYGVVDTASLLAIDSETPAAQVELSEDLRRTLEATGQKDAVVRMIGSTNVLFRRYPTEDTARDALTARTVKGYFVVPPGYIEKGGLAIYTPDTMNVSGSDARNAFATLVRQRLLAGRTDAPVAARVVNPMAGSERYGLSRSGEVSDGGGAASALRFGVPLIFMVLLLMSILMTSGYLLQGTAVEKENKVVEVLLASANPDEILAGKLLGLGGAGLLQIAVWLSIVIALGVGAVPMLMDSGLEVPWMALAMALPLFVVAFLFFGSLMLGSGSLGTNMREAQQYAMIWSLTAALPMMMMAVLIRAPHGLAAQIMTWLPFTAAPVVMLRASTDAGALAWWEVVGPFAVLLVSTWLALRLGARLFRIGLLSASRPKLREVIRQARLGA